MDSGVHRAIASVTAASMDSLGSPKQVHISLSGSANEMVVTYVTGTTTTPSVRFA